MAFYCYWVPLISPFNRKQLNRLLGDLQHPRKQGSISELPIGDPDLDTVVEFRSLELQLSSSFCCSCFIQVPERPAGPEIIITFCLPVRSGFPVGVMTEKRGLVGVGYGSPLLLVKMSRNQFPFPDSRRHTHGGSSTGSGGALDAAAGLSVLAW